MKAIGTRALAGPVAGVLLSSILATSTAPFALAQTPAPPAAAQPDKLKQAKVLFRAGANAYRVHKYGAAAQSFRQAYNLAPKPAILFSLAQAERRNFFEHKDPASLRGAIEAYKGYLKNEPNGRRRADAIEALALLEPMQGRISATAPVGPPKPPRQQVSRITVTSSVQSALVRFDGSPPRRQPFIAKVKPGTHSIVVSAKGYEPLTRQITITKGSGMVPVDVQLKSKPATLILVGEHGATVRIDNEYAGVLAGELRVSLDAGKHVVVLSKPGFHTVAFPIKAERGQSMRIERPMKHTSQRTVSWGLLTAGGVVLGSSVVFGVIAASHQSDAQKIFDRTSTGSISPQDRADYQSSLDSRDSNRRLAGIQLGAALAILVVGGGLYLFDSPEAPPPVSLNGEKPPSQKKKNSFFDELFGAPVILPNQVGMGVGGRF